MQEKTWKKQVSEFLRRVWFCRYLSRMNCHKIWYPSTKNNSNWASSFSLNADKMPYWQHCHIKAPVASNVFGIGTLSDLSLPPSLQFLQVALTVRLLQLRFFQKIPGRLNMIPKSLVEFTGRQEERTRHMYIKLPSIYQSICLSIELIYAPTYGFILF